MSQTCFRVRAQSALQVIEGVHQLLSEYGRAPLADALREWLEVDEYAALEQAVEKVSLHAQPPCAGKCLRLPVTSSSLAHHSVGMGC